VLAAWFKQANESNASINGTNLKEKTLHNATHPTFQLSMDGSTD
jgi:hypothetical protein